MINTSTYISKLQEILETVKVQQIEAIQRAGALVAAALEAGELSRSSVAATLT